MLNGGKFMNEIEILLTEEFAVFSRAVASIHEEKKLLEEEFKKYFEDYKSKKSALESKVSVANSKWEDWKKKQLKKD
jgi:hypothetical protein